MTQKKNSECNDKSKYFLPDKIIWFPFAFQIELNSSLDIHQIRLIHLYKLSSNIQIYYLWHYKGF